MFGELMMEGGKLKKKKPKVEGDVSLSVNQIQQMH